MWKHGNYSVYQIYARTTFLRFPVKCRILLYIVGHICNMNAQMIILSIFGKAYCIIKILGIFSVDCYHLYISQICSACHICLCHSMSYIFSLMQNLLREFHRQFIASDNRHNIYAWIIYMSKYFDNLAFRFTIIFSIICNLTYYFVA